MSLTPTEVEEVNALLSKEELGFPEFRKTIGKTGANVAWVRKALSSTGKGSPRLRELIGAKEPVKHNEETV